MKYSDYYKEQLEIGLRYQDFVAEQLYSIGLPLFNYSSKEYQIKHGENKLGVEIKHDMKFESTGNLWIEVKEKSNPENKRYVDSGIHRKDNTWLFIIGNYNEIFVFTKKLLMLLYKSGRYKVIQNTTKTSKGFLLNRADAEKYAAKIIKMEI